MPVEDPQDATVAVGATPDIYFKGARLMNTRGLLKCAGAVVALAIVSACGGGSTVAPSAAPFKATYWVRRCS